MKVSVIIVTARRKDLLERCLQSIYSEFKNINYEIILIFNGDLSYEKNYPENSIITKIICSKEIFPSAARNLGIRKARYENIFFIDDDAFLPSGYFQTLIGVKDWSVLGGPDLPPKDSSPTQILISEVQSSIFCMGTTRHRHSQILQSPTYADESMLSLCNLWIKKSLLTDDNLFPNFLFRSEENYWLKKQTQSNIVYHPSLFVFHQRKESIARLLQTIKLSGFYRSKNFIKKPNFHELVYFTPVLSLFILFFLLFINIFVFFILGILGSLIIIIYQFYKFKKISSQFFILHILILAFYSMGLIKGFFVKQINLNNSI